MTLAAVIYTDEQLAIIANLCPSGAPIDTSVWSSDSIKSIKSAIKSHYIAAQSSRCSYCDRHLGSENHRIWDVDHIVPRSTHPQFTFEPLNLTAACPDCNVAKRNARVLKNQSRKTYPSASGDFKILHPHFDRYADHIFRDRHVYVPKTKKGKRTIYACDLLRFAQKYIDWSTSIVDDRYEAEVEAALSGGPLAVAAVRKISASLRG